MDKKRKDKEIKAEKEGEIKPKEGTAVARRPSESWLSSGFDSMFDDFRRSFDDLMAPFLPFRSSLATFEDLPTRYALCDLIDKGNHYMVRAELPGYSKDTVDIQVSNDHLELKAEMKREEEEKAEDYLHRERTYSSCQRSIAFPEEIIPSKVKAEMKDGILEIRAPKKSPKPEETMRKVKIE